MIQDNSKYTKLKGQLERVTYENPENGYTVAKLKVYGYSELVTGGWKYSFPESWRSF